MMRKHTYAFYWLFRLFIVLPTVRVYFDRIYLVNPKRVQKGKATFFAGNHPDSFLDGVVMSFFAMRTVWIVVRGDVFKNPLANRVLRSLRLLPIYRSSDATAVVARKGNERTTEAITHLFQKKKAVLIFSEGSSYPEKKLRTLMRGTAKMMLELPDKLAKPDDLVLQTVGLNYDRFYERGGQFSLVFGKTMVREELSSKNHTTYTVDDINSVNSTIRKNLSPLILQWAEKEEAAQDCVLRLVSHETNHGWRFVQKNDTYFRRSKKALNRWKESADSVRTKAVAYHSLIQESLKNDLCIKPIPVSLRMVVSLLLFIPAAIGYALYNPGWWLAWKITKKKIKSPVFIDSIYFGLSMIFGLLFNAIVLLICLILLPTWKLGLLAFLCSKLCYYIYLLFRPEYRHLNRRIFTSIPKEDRKQAKSIRLELLAHFLSD